MGVPRRCRSRASCCTNDTEYDPLLVRAPRSVGSWGHTSVVGKSPQVAALGDNALEPEVRSGRVSRSTHHVMITDHSPLISQTPPLASRPAVRSLC